MAISPLGSLDTGTQRWYTTAIGLPCKRLILLILLDCVDNPFLGTTPQPKWLESLIRWGIEPLTGPQHRDPVRLSYGLPPCQRNIDFTVQ